MTQTKRQTKREANKSAHVNVSCASKPEEPKTQTQKADKREWCIDDICERLARGEMANRIAREYGKSPSSLSEWLASKPERSARAKQATAMGASAWDAQAEDDLRAAADPFALSKAVALGQHYRWRASKLDQARYGDKQQHEHAGGITVNVNTGVKRADD